MAANNVSPVAYTSHHASSMKAILIDPELFETLYPIVAANMFESGFFTAGSAGRGVGARSKPGNAMPKEENPALLLLNWLSFLLVRSADGKSTVSACYADATKCSLTLVFASSSPIFQMKYTQAIVHHVNTILSR
jgi:hypothetical protein